METTADYVADRTREFWVLSMIRNGCIESKMTTHQAIRQINALSAGVGPHRLLALRIDALMQDIIKGPNRNKSAETPQNLLQLRLQPTV